MLNDLADHITVLNEILRSVGSAPIAGPDEETKKAQQATAVYRRTFRELLSRNTAGWTFARKTYRLDRDPLVPENGWRFGFAMPGTRLGNPRRVLSDPRRPDFPLRQFAIEANLLFADVEPVWATFTVEVPPAAWSPEFHSLMVAAVGSRLAVPLGHDTSLADELRREAFGAPQEMGRGGLFAVALNADIAGAPSAAPVLASDPLTGAWMS